MCCSLNPVLFPIIFRGTSHKFLKYFTEIAAGAETAVFAYGDNTLICPQQHLRCRTDAVFTEIIHGRNFYTPLKAAAAFPGADAGGCGNVLESYFFCKMVMDIIHHCLQSFRINSVSFNRL